jgi:hypothetical protein
MNNRLSVALKIAASTLRQSNIYRSAVPPIEDPAWASNCAQGHGSQAGPLALPNAALWDAVHRSRGTVLRGAAPMAADQLPQAESRQLWIENH